MSANIIESFFVALGFEVQTEKLDEFKKRTAELREGVLAVGSIAAGAALGIGLLVEKVAGSMGDLYSFAELNQVSARSVAALGKIAVENDGSMEGMKSTIQSLNKVVGEAAIGVGRGAATFEKLGLHAKNADGSVKDVNAILGDVADKMQGMSRQEQIAMAEKLGIDPQFVKVLEQGSDGLARLRDEAEAMNPFSEQDYQLADEVDKLFVKAKNTAGVFTKMLGVSLLPVVKDVLKQYLEWFKASRQATSGVMITGLHAITAALGTLWDWVVRIVSSTKNAIQWLSQLKFVTYAAAAALALFTGYKVHQYLGTIIQGLERSIKVLRGFTAASMGAAILPAIIGLTVIALGLLIDDFINFKEGNDSVIGGLVKQFPQLLDVINTISDGVSAFVDFWVEQWGTLQGPLTELAQSLWKLVVVVAQAVWPAIKMIFTGWAYLMAAIIPIVAKLIEWLAGFLVGAIRFAVQAITWVLDAGTAVFSGLLSLVGGVIDGIVAYFQFWWDVVSAGYGFITGLFSGMVSAIASGVSGVIDWVLGLVDSAKQRILGFVDSVTGAIRKVGELLGLTDKAGDKRIEVKSTSADAQQGAAAARAVAAPPADASPVARAVAASPAMTGRPAPSGHNPRAVASPELRSGVLGRAEGRSTSQTTVQNNTTTITAPITVNSPDPAKAGESVRHELDRVNKQSTRNGQRAVAL